MPHGSARMLHQTPAGKLQVVRLSLEYGSRGGSVWFGSADADESARVVGDAGRLTQIFANLLNNAAKYTDPGGRICIEAEVEREHIRVCIRDNGAGMSSEMIPRRFGIFEQGSSTIERARGGLGIGLALVKKFVELHSGTIVGTSPGLGLGSEFPVTLPPAAAVPLQRDPRPAASSGVRIMLVDDNLDVPESLGFILQDYGYRVATAHDPIEALRVAAEFGPTTVVVDIGLPGMGSNRSTSRF